jgi:hypothetical protein
MDIYEHGQNIYTQLLVAQLLTNRPLPNGNELTKWADMAMRYARAFHDTNKG